MMRGATRTPAALLLGGVGQGKAGTMVGYGTGPARQLENKVAPRSSLAI